MSEPNLVRREGQAPRSDGAKAAKRNRDERRGRIPQGPQGQDFRKGLLRQEIRSPAGGQRRFRFDRGHEGVRKQQTEHSRHKEMSAGIDRVEPFH